jgi:hypothetical protein|tara:strand:+ start:877 stop:1755 length:879 start_codon:yes stop_codon:yes gene_type:complete
MSYFSLFPKIGYDYNREGVIQNVVNIFRHVRPVQNYIDNLAAYKNYSIRNGERPDIVSQRLYGTPDYHWTFFVVNDFLHDGISVWPMSQENLFEYIATEYNGVAIETRPDVKYNTDGGIEDFRDSLAGRFKVGESVIGGISNATGTLTKKDLYNNQLIIQNVTGSFIGDGVGNNRETINGLTSTDTVSSWKVWDYAEAPHHWFGGSGYVSEIDYKNQGGVDAQIQVSNANFFSTTDDATLNLVLQEGTVAQPSYISNRNYLFDLNEERSQIRIVDPRHIEKFAETFETLINA